MRKFKEICVNGHNRRVWGVNKNGNCKACRKDDRLRTVRGITLEEFRSLGKIQNGRCGICKNPLELEGVFQPGWANGTRTEVDHEHGNTATLADSIRGLLCASCNYKLGRLSDSLEWIQAALAYLLDPPARKDTSWRNENLSTA